MHRFLQDHCLFGRSRVGAILVLASLGASAAPTRALAPGAVSPEFPVAPLDCTVSPIAPDLVDLGHRRSVAVWSTRACPADGAGAATRIVAQVRGADDQPIGGPVAVVAFGPQDAPLRAFRALPTRDGFLVAWEIAGPVGGSSISFRRFDATGAARSGATSAVLTAEQPFLSTGFAARAAGGLAVAWTQSAGDYDGQEFPTDVWIQSVDDQGVAVHPARRVHPQIGATHRLDAIQPLPGGRFLAMWEGAGPGDANGAFVGVLAADGTPTGEPVRLGRDPSFVQGMGDLGVDAQGATWAVWNQSEPRPADCTACSSVEIHFQHLDAQGRPDREEGVLMPQVATVTPYETARVSVGPAGDAVIYRSGLDEFLDFGVTTVRAWRFDTEGRLDGHAFALNSRAAGRAEQSVVRVLEGGDLLALYPTTSALYGHRFTLDPCYRSEIRPVTERPAVGADGSTVVRYERIGGNCGAASLSFLAPSTDFEDDVAPLKATLRWKAGESKAQAVTVRGTGTTADLRSGVILPVAWNAVGTEIGVVPASLAREDGDGATAVLAVDPVTVDGPVAIGSAAGGWTSRTSLSVHPTTSRTAD